MSCWPLATKATDTDAICRRCICRNVLAGTGRTGPASGRSARTASYDTAIAPNLWWFEVRNALIVSERRGRMDWRGATAALSLLRELAVELDMAAAEAGLMELARKHRLTVYDAAYLELAKRKGLPLATLDGALAAAANAESVPLIGAAT